MAFNPLGKNGSVIVIILSVVSIACFVAGVIIDSDIQSVVFLISFILAIVAIVFGVLNFLDRKDNFSIIALIVAAVCPVMIILAPLIFGM